MVTDDIPVFRFLTDGYWGAAVKAKALAVTSILSMLLAPLSSAWSPDRLPDGKPDFEGVRTNASLTRLERPAGVKDLVIPPEDADKPLGANDWNAHAESDSRPSEPDAA